MGGNDGAIPQFPSVMRNQDIALRILRMGGTTGEVVMFLLRSFKENSKFPMSISLSI